MQQQITSRISMCSIFMKMPKIFLQNLPTYPYVSVCKFFIVPHLCGYLELIVFSNAHSVGELMLMVLPCGLIMAFLMTNETEHALICLLAFWISYFWLSVESYTYFSIPFLTFRVFFWVWGIVLSVVKNVF